MRMESFLGARYSLSLGDPIQRKAIEWNNSEKHKILGPLGARVIGVIAKPIARIADVAIHLILAAGKIMVGIIASPIYLALYLKNEIGPDTTWTVKHGLLHLAFATVFFADIFVSPITNLIDPNIDPVFEIGAHEEVRAELTRMIVGKEEDFREIQDACRNAERQLAAARNELAAARNELAAAREELQLHGLRG